MPNETKTDEVFRTLSQRILDGAYARGQRLPAERELGDEFNVSRQTIRYALNRLQSEDLIEIIPSSGAYVRARRPKVEVGPFVPPLMKGAKPGKQPGASLDVKIVSMRHIVPAGVYEADKHIAEKLHVEEKTLLWRRRRLYLESDIPYRILESYSPLALLEQYSPQRKDPFECLSNHEKQFPDAPTFAVEHVNSRLPSSEEAELLNISRSQPVFDIDRWLFIDKEEIAEYTRTIANAALQTFTYVMSDSQYYRESNWNDLFGRDRVGSE